MQIQRLMTLVSFHLGISVSAQIGFIINNNQLSIYIIQIWSQTWESIYKNSNRGISDLGIWD